MREKKVIRRPTKGKIYKFNFYWMSVIAAINFSHFSKMDGEFIPFPRNMKFDIINISYPGNKASQRGQTSKAFPCINIIFT